MKRLFRAKSELIGDRRVAVHRITCGCGHSETVSTSQGGNPLPPEAVAKHFRLKGWEMSDREGRDRCPTCIHAEALERRAKRLRLVEAKAKVAAPEEALSLAAETVEVMKEPPLAEPAEKAQPETVVRTQTRDDRRIIFTTINDVYLDADRGYKPGWSDKRVADHLGIPLQWAKDIRDEMFGPEGENAEVRLLLEQVEALRDEAQRDMDQMVTLVTNATRRMDELSHRLNMLSAQATRLTAAIA